MDDHTVLHLWATRNPLFEEFEAQLNETDRIRYRHNGWVSPWDQLEINDVTTVGVTTLLTVLGYDMREELPHIYNLPRSGDYRDVYDGRFVDGGRQRLCNLLDKELLMLERPGPSITGAQVAGVEPLAMEYPLLYQPEHTYTSTER